MHEPATTLTDYLLMLECGAFAIALARSSTPGPLRLAFIVLFASAALASFTGGTVHGFFSDPQSAASRALWLLTLLSIGGTAAAMVAVAARIAASHPPPGLGAVLAAGWLAYAAVALFVSREFVVAIAAYLPASLLLMAALIGRWRRRRTASAAAAGIVGVLLALLGAAGQQVGIGLHPVHFDHNAVYHVVQMLALYLLFRCARGLIAADEGEVVGVP